MPELKKFKSQLAKLPSVDTVLNTAVIRGYLQTMDNNFVTHCIREALLNLRNQIRKSDSSSGSIDRDTLIKKAVQSVEEKIKDTISPGLKRVINATGIILHTGLGRAPLPTSVEVQLSQIITNYCNLELNLKTGKRGERLDYVNELLCLLSGAERSAVVNNNAAAVLIALNTLAKNKEVIISRGQLVEIGGSFRIPDIMEQSGAIIKEIGTTNKTHLKDYKNAISRNTGAILIAHTSNYRVQGFTAEVALPDVVELANANKIPIIYDLGGGVFLDLVKFDLPYEPVIPEIVQRGVDVITFSGDKVLGGPQSGLLVGKEKQINDIRKNPLMRAVRCDKLILSALEATLKIYLNQKNRLQEIPVFRMLLEPISNQKKRGEKILAQVEPLNEKLHFKLEDGTSQIGSGALPLVEIPSLVITIESNKYSEDQISTLLRSCDIPIIGYVKEGKNILNLRTIRDDEIPIIVKQLQSLV